MLTARSQVKEIMSQSGFDVPNLGSDFMQKLDEKVKQLILDALKRAKENGRRTVLGRDL